MKEESGGGPGDVIMATGGYDHTVKIWHAKTGVVQRNYQHQGSQVNALEIASDKQTIAAAGYQQISIYELNSKNPCPVTTYDGLVKNVTSVGFQEDGRFMYTGGEDMSARVWDLRTRSFQCQRIFQVQSPVNCLCLHPNQTELLVGDQSGVIHLWDLCTDHNEQLIPEAEASILDIDIDPSGSLMAAVNNKGHCYIWTLSRIGDEPSKLNPKHKIKAHNTYAIRCKFSPDSTLLVTTSGDETARVWKTSDFSLVQEMKKELQQWIWGAAFTVDSRYLMTASSDMMARLWVVETGAIDREYSGHQKAITALAFKDEAI